MKMVFGVFGPHSFLQHGINHLLTFNIIVSQVFRHEFNLIVLHFAFFRLNAWLVEM